MAEYPINAMIDRYCFYMGNYVFMRGGLKINPHSRYGRKQIVEHFMGVISLCVFAGPSNTKFLTIDVDMPEPEVVHKVVDTMEALGIPRDRIYVSLSGGKGYHVDIFFEQSIYNWRAKVLYDLIIYFGGFDKSKVEYRPSAKQAIKLPLGVHQKTGNRCWYVDRETLEPIEDFSYIEQTEKIPLWVIDKVLRDGNKRRFNSILEEISAEGPQRKRRTKTGKTLQGYDITEPGTRHKMMINVALKLYRDGGTYESIHDDLEDWYFRQDQSLISSPPEECLRDIDMITGWVMQKGRRGELGEDPHHEYHRNTRIYETDAKRIIQCETKNARMMAFLFTIYCDKYGFCGLSGKKLGDALGISSNKTIVTASNEIVEKRLFHKKKGGMLFQRDTYRKVTNKFEFPRDYDRGGEFIEIDGLVEQDNLYEMYVRTLAALCDLGELREHLTNKEFSDCKKMEVKE